MEVRCVVPPIASGVLRGCVEGFTRLNILLIPMMGLGEPGEGMILKLEEGVCPYDSERLLGDSGDRAVQLLVEDCAELLLFKLET